VALAGALTVNCEAAAALTVMAPLVPVMLPVTVSAAVIVRLRRSSGWRRRSRCRW